MALEKNFDAKEAEARLYAAWESSGAFKAGANASRAETYSVMIPPPNVNGSLHVGHAFNNTLQDILTRWHRMRGFDTLWQPGQDHAGIALQLAVENKLAESQIKRTDLTRDEFLKHAWEYKEATADTIVSQLKRLGSSCDWSRNAFTMSGAPGDTRVGHENSPNFHDAVIKVFVKMYNEGKIYRGKRLVNWDPRFETAISDLEVENIEVPGHMWHFKYPLADGATYEYVEKDEDGNVTLRETRDYISIATTRPETMLGDGAVAVHPSDERYAPIVGKLCEIPVGPKALRRLIPIITDEYPDKDFGSGAVKITGAHDFNDYQVAKRGGIPMYNLMDTKAAMRADGKPYAEEAAVAQAISNGEREFDEAMIAAMNLVPDEYRGLDRFEAREKVIADITAEGLAVMHDVTRTVKDEDGNKSEVTETIPYVESKPIMQPFGDRSKVVIEPMLTDQWFVDTNQIVGPALDAVRNGDVKIMPESGEKVYYNWLDNIEPWCISRQLWWGHQIPVWFDAEENEFCAPTEAEAIKMARQHYEKRFPNIPVEVKATPKAEATFEDSDGRTYAWAFLMEVMENDEGKEDKVKSVSVEIARDPDVLDTWFSSGLWPIGTLGWPEETDAYSKYFPTSDLITGQDILFFWVARMMMMQLDTVEKIPFNTVYLHGLVRDAKGKKMSKSVGNVIDPLEIIDGFGADALRFTNAAMASLGGALKMEEQRIAGYRNFGTKVWNAHKFAEMNGVFEARPVYTRCTDGVPPVTPAATLNKWIIGETARVLEEVDAALETYRFNDAANALYAFVWGKVCDWYVELSKPLLQDEDGKGALAKETRETMAWVLDQCLILLHPIMPFITEELWGETAKRDKMIVHADWPTYTTDALLDADADREMNWVISLIENIRSARAQMHVPAGLKVPMIVTVMDDAAQAAWDNNETMIKRLARVETLDKADTFPKGTVAISAPGATFGLPLEGLIDIDEEKARLQKSLDKLAKEIGGLNGRLKNPKFAASAPAEVVAEAKANLAARQEEADQLQAAMDRLSEIG
ncbi:valine--tRNA ligase [Sulfitobacter donghicola]|uniref:Valine--tRNA ligase n=1 Tax=Sulfitobacter donghicola DSW-25 = KCTC 12864 = JCM 14565 TaxID=1300350 RepID=A0A073IHF5_9RHOB|nr:valine--tRNA ligase [Sulfitobacter donghicola]KEJ89209.1 valyl-tRNA synthetase [Sulfitobacter donghicola DSW-25 = KCTC 12864 = JCM 14565]KIN68999.1 Valyl-tRNA synthetase [Sulfitobacter donghicola DSW-25 = KCTC 12864 = JCM 14565]